MNFGYEGFGPQQMLLLDEVSLQSSEENRRNPRKVKNLNQSTSVAEDNFLPSSELLRGGKKIFGEKSIKNPKSVKDIIDHNSLFKKKKTP